MFYSITGEIVYSDTNTVAVQCGGVAFSCNVTFNTIKKIGPVGSQVTLYTYLNVKEDALDLFGFYEKSELDMFKMLISVSGVGPKAGLAILSELEPSQLVMCIATGDSKSITRAQGVGPKVAGRVVLELKDKIVKNMTGASASEDFKAAAAATVNAGQSNVSEAVSALVMLGYSQSEASIAVGKCDPTLKAEDIIKQALKNLM
ncbi:MAG: Holliday junction branch migration protein RuvA [Oscillospiraceae bacterium]|nr:Holliday junction branch migration protein RuvA [Oscillospiraceae bacterium]